MICAKEFSEWLRHRFSTENAGISISRDNINQLTGRQRLDPSFVNDVHYELMQYGMAFFWFIAAFRGKPLLSSRRSSLYLDTHIPFA